MYKLFIVDDEIDVVEGVKSTVDWGKHGVEVCGSANNGLEALNLIHELSPDLLIVDVNMPVMDGIELLQKLKNEGSDLEFLILSGYDEFSYAQKAVNLGATDYLLKPCRPQDILRAVLRARSIAEEKKSREKLLAHYAAQFHNNIPILRERFLSRLLEGKVSDLAGAREEMDLYKISLPQGDSTVVLFKIDKAFPAGRNNLMNMETSKLAVRDVIKKEFESASFQAEVFIYKEYVAAIAGLDADGHSLRKLPVLLDGIREKVVQNVGLTVTAGVGNPVSSPPDMWKCYSECCSAIDTKSFLGENRVIFFSDVVLEQKKAFAYPYNREMDIINCLHTGNKDGLPAKIDGFYDEMAATGPLSKDFIQNASIVLIGNIFRFCMEEKIDTQAVFAGQDDFFGEMLRCGTLFELKEKIGGLLCKIVDHMNKRENINKFVDMAIDYIKSNYSGDIGLETIAKKVYITPGYLSMLFKQAVGVNFVDFLNQYRVQMSKEYIKDYRFKLYEIANKVGFQDEKYFSQIFKKYTGLTPKQYRETLNTALKL